MNLYILQDFFFPYHFHSAVSLHTRIQHKAVNLSMVIFIRIEKKLITENQ